MMNLNLLGMGNCMGRSFKIRLQNKDLWIYMADMFLFGVGMG